MEFAFKELQVWQKAIDFAEKILGLIERMDTSRSHYRIIEQIEASAISISNNIAEGKGRHSQKEFIQYLYTQVSHIKDSLITNYKSGD
jgi:four helix bundle protein